MKQLFPIMSIMTTSRDGNRGVPPRSPQCERNGKSHTGSNPPMHAPSPLPQDDAERSPLALSCFLLRHAYLFCQGHWHRLPEFIKAAVDPIPPPFLDYFVRNRDPLENTLRDRT